MLKCSKIAAFVAATVGATLFGGGCGWSGFGGGLFARGLTDNVWIDVVTDWLNEDLFS
jgi:hypothetical protein